VRTRTLPAPPVGRWRGHDLPRRWQSLLRWRIGEALLSVITALVLLVLIVYPLLAILVQSVLPGLFDIHPTLTPTLANLQGLVTTPTNLAAVINSGWLGLGVALGASLIGAPLALLVARTDLPLRQLMNAAVWVVFFTPSFVMAAAWLVLITPRGILSHLLPLPNAIPDTFFNLGGVIFVLSLKLFPFVYLSVYAGLASLGSEFSDAARTVGAKPWRAFLSIDLPLLLPTVLAGAIIVFAEAISDFGTVATIAQQSSFPLLTYQIYTALNTAPTNFPRAAAFALLLILAIGVAMLFQSLLLRRRDYGVITGRLRPARIIALGYWRLPALTFCIVIIGLALGLPLLGAALTATMTTFVNGFAPSNFTWQNFANALAVGSSNLTALERSLIIALICATIVAIAALPLTYALERTEMRGRQVLNLMTLTTIAVPGIVLAAGYIFAWNQPWQAHAGLQLYGTIELLVLALIAGTLPYAIRLYTGGLSQVHGSLLDAARIHGAGVWRVLIMIVFPLLRHQVVNIWMLVFGTSMFELAAAELLYPPGQPTMPVEILSLIDDFRLGTAMALTLLSVLALALTLLLVHGLFRLLTLQGCRRERQAH
jgi:iron(III) transport system permease protein